MATHDHNARADGQLTLGLEVPTISRCVSMARIEVFVPAEYMNLPECLVAAFEGRLHDLDAERVETVSIYGTDLPRDLRREEKAALEIAQKQYGVFYKIFRR